MNRHIVSLSIIIISLIMIFYYKKVNKYFDKILNIKRMNYKKKKNKLKINFKSLLYLTPLLYIIGMDAFGVMTNHPQVLSVAGLYDIIPENAIKYILKILGGYGIVQVLAQDLGVKTGINQRNLIQNPLAQFLLCWGGAFAISGTVSQGFLAALLYFVLRNNVSNGKTSNVCFEDV
jgi:hypothetical protein